MTTSTGPHYSTTGKVLFLWTYFFLYHMTAMLFSEITHFIKIIQVQTVAARQQQKSALPKQICLGNNDALEGYTWYNQHLISLKLFPKVSHSHTNISKQIVM